MLSIIIGLVVSSVILISLMIKWKRYREGGWEERKKLISYITTVFNIMLLYVSLFVIITIIRQKGDGDMQHVWNGFILPLLVSLVGGGLVSWFIHIKVLKNLPQDTKEHVSDAMETKVLAINENVNQRANTLNSNEIERKAELVKDHTEMKAELVKDHTEIKAKIERLVEDMVRKEGMKASDNTGGIRAAETAMQVLIEKVQSEERLKSEVNELKKQVTLLTEQNKELIKGKQSVFKQEIKQEQPKEIEGYDFER